MTIACKKHQKEPIVGYKPCPRCEVERLRNELQNLKQQFNVAVGLLLPQLALFGLEVGLCHLKGCLRWKSD